MATISIRFGTRDVRPAPSGLRPPYTAVRVYAKDGQDVRREPCGHAHRGEEAALRCARSLSLGMLAGYASCDTWCEIVAAGSAEAARVVAPRAPGPPPRDLADAMAAQIQRDAAAGKRRRLGA